MHRIIPTSDNTGTHLAPKGEWQEFIYNARKGNGLRYGQVSIPLQIFPPNEICYLDLTRLSSSMIPYTNNDKIGSRSLMRLWISNRQNIVLASTEISTQIHPTALHLAKEKVVKGVVLVHGKEVLETTIESSLSKVGGEKGESLFLSKQPSKRPWMNGNSESYKAILTPVYRI